VGASSHAERQWRAIATVETRAGTDLSGLAACERYDVRVEPVDGSPAGCRWFNVLIDAARGEEHYVLAARAVLRTLHRLRASGVATGFHVVDGNQWLAWYGADSRHAEC
jgi:hypothetical protein